MKPILDERSGEAAPFSNRNKHELIHIENEDDAIRVHIELPPVDMNDVIVDVSCGEIEVLIREGKHENIYCSVDVPVNADIRHWERIIVPGHLEVVMGKR